jgi:CRISPR-associated endonuclease Cas1
MVATSTVPQSLLVSNSVAPIKPHLGVITLYGFGTKVRVERGHLIVEDGIGPERRKARFARIGHNLRRLVVVGSDGMVSLSALRWLADQNASFVMLDRTGSPMLTTGPVRPSDARIRRAQAMSQASGVAMYIARELITRKIQGQERVVREKIGSESTSALIADARIAVRNANSIDALRQIEAQAAAAYWTAWRDIKIRFTKKDIQRVPDHWRRFGGRSSPLTGSPRLAVNPPNAMLNYLYALLESECSLALAALGLDPGIGVFHFDSRSRNSLACDLMEAVRPEIDKYIFDWISGQFLKREWFFEERNGNCRLTGPFAEQLSETAQTWASIAAPQAEWIAKTLWQTLPRPSRRPFPATRLTQNSRRAAKGGHASNPKAGAPKTPHLCRNCGELLKDPQNRTCRVCAIADSRTNLIEAAKLGRMVTHLPKAQALRAQTQRRQAAARKLWNPEEIPIWLTEPYYRDQIRPLLKTVTVSRISATLGVSEPYATDIRKGKRLPHPRHWVALAALAVQNQPRPDQTLPPPLRI